MYCLQGLLPESQRWIQMGRVGSSCSAPEEAVQLAQGKAR